MATSVRGEARLSEGAIQPIMETLKLGDEAHAVVPFVPVSLFEIELKIRRSGGIIYVFFGEGQIGRPRLWGRVGIRLDILGRMIPLGI